MKRGFPKTSIPALHRRPRRLQPRLLRALPSLSLPCDDVLRSAVLWRTRGTSGDGILLYLMYEIRKRSSQVLFIFFVLLYSTAFINVILERQQKLLPTGSKWKLSNR